ncbi:MAG: NUDIX hydrolase [Cyanothece sp. SIO1E1]|nr:NUDIX hydrolase [Cyanothece sp. SIO1E1]
MPEKWKTLRSQLVFDHRWYKVRQDEIELPNGNIIDDYLLSVRPDVALVLPITATEDIVMVRQYRHGANEVLLELPAGTFDPTDESAASAAARELQEETGYTADTLIQLATLYDNPVKQTSKIHLFLAPNAYPAGPQCLDATEEIEILQVPTAAVIEKILHGEISVAGSLAAIFLGLKFLKKL